MRISTSFGSLGCAMTLSILDYFIITVYVLVILAVGFFYRQRAGKDLTEYFLSGRSLPWWIAGTSMVATTFAADTPLAVTGLVIQHGLAGNWFWWAFALGGMITVFIYARLWRRAGVMTDVEFVELRYSGKPAASLRFIRAVYIALIVNPIIIGWVTGAMVTLMEETVMYGRSPMTWQTTLFGQEEVNGDVDAGQRGFVIIPENPIGGGNLTITYSGEELDVANVSCFAGRFEDFYATRDDPEVGNVAGLPGSFVKGNAIARPVFRRDGNEQYFVTIVNDSDRSIDFQLRSDGSDLFLSENRLKLRTWAVLFAALALVGLYCSMSGMWGVAITDVIQFVLAMAGCIMLAVVAVNHLGGVQALQDQVNEQFGGAQDEAFQFIPFDSDSSGVDDAIADDAATDDAATEDSGERSPVKGSGTWMPMYVFMIMLLVQWWATWYPGAEPGGGGYVVQRMASCKDERHSVYATLWYQIAHYCIRPWPWLIVAFAALAMYPELRAAELVDNDFDSGVGFPRVIRELSPNGLRGLLMVTFFAAFMSTISTQMNWGASYLVRDVYQRFFSQNATDQQLTGASRWASIIVLVAGGVAAFKMQDMSVDAAWKMLAALGAGTGLVFMLRWFWWRVNAWSEISSMVASLGCFVLFDQFYKLSGTQPPPAEVKMLIVAVLTILVWIAVTYITSPEKQEVLDAFYQKVRPGGFGWGPVSKRNSSVEVDRDLIMSMFGALAATGIVYFTIPGVGNVIFGNYSRAGMCGLGAAICALIVAVLVRRLVSASKSPTQTTSN